MTKENKETEVAKENKVKETKNRDTISAELVDDLKKRNQSLKEEIDLLKVELNEFKSGKLVFLDGCSYEVEGEVETVSSLHEKAKKRFVEQDRTVVVLKRHGF